MAVLRMLNVNEVAACLSIYTDTLLGVITSEFLKSVGISTESISEGLSSNRIFGIACYNKEDHLIGFILADNQSGGILAIAVAKHFQGQGHGGSLLRSAIKALKKRGFKWTWVYTSPDTENRALGFYKHFGLRPTGDYDEYGNQALMISTNLDIAKSCARVN